MTLNQKLLEERLSIGRGPSNTYLVYLDGHKVIHETVDTSKESIRDANLFIAELLLRHENG
jgi:hypothetical protein